MERRRQGQLYTFGLRCKPSYLPGPLTPGKWDLVLGVPNIRPEVVSEFVAKLYFDRSVADDASDPLLELSLRPEAGWYRGDLHMHTAYSDGTCKSQSGQKVPCPLFRSVESAAARGLDFIAITDHNTESHYDEERELQPWFDKILLMPGREITPTRGTPICWEPAGMSTFASGPPKCLR